MDRFSRLLLPPRTIDAPVPSAAAVAGARLGDGRGRPGRGGDPLETQVRPLLAQTCFRCHGGEKTAHDLRVDSRGALLKGGKNGPAIVPGQPDKSLLLA